MMGFRRYTVLFGLLTQYTPAIARKIVVPLHMVLYVAGKVVPALGRLHHLYGVFALFLLECAICAMCIKLCQYGPDGDWRIKFYSFTRTGGSCSPVFVS